MIEKEYDGDNKSIVNIFILIMASRLILVGVFEFLRAKFISKLYIDKRLTVIYSIAFRYFLTMLLVVYLIFCSTKLSLEEYLLTESFAMLIIAEISAFFLFGVLAYHYHDKS